MVNIEIDEGSGFCFGVTTAIRKAEEELAKGNTLYCLGDIVHNGQECERLKKMGLITINHEEFAQLHDAKVLLRAHGEPPETYAIARTNNIEIIDATCPVVLRLQKRIKQEYDNVPASQDTQIVIYGKNGHAEVLGLVGQTHGKAIVIETPAEAAHLDFTKDIRLYSQTTKSLEEFWQIIEYIKEHISPDATFEYYDTICRQVANRMPNIRKFAAAHDLIFFVCGRKSSNGKILYQECKKINPNSYLIDQPEEIDRNLLHHTVEDAGIVLGQALKEALGEKKGIVRYGQACIPLDESLSRVVLDLSGRPGLYFDCDFTAPMIGALDSQLVREFFQAVSNHAGMTLHIDNLKGENAHHQAESIFKAFARALRAAVATDERAADVIPSTKGAL